MAETRKITAILVADVVGYSRRLAGGGRGGNAGAAQGAAQRADRSGRRRAPWAHRQAHRRSHVSVESLRQPNRAYVANSGSTLGDLSDEEFTP
jgi:hypothetical protein